MAARDPAKHREVPPVLWVVVFFLVAALLQLAQPIWFDADTGYHIAVGRLIAEHGPLREFPWTPYSLMHEQYADTELVFHLLFTALSPLPPDAAAKLVGTVLGTAILTTMFFFLRSERVPLPGVWTLVALASSGAFAVRFLSVRPHLLAILLSLWVLWAAVRRRWVVLGLLSVAFPWCYLAWISAFGLVLVAEAARWLTTRELDWRGPALSAAGIGLGLVLHPNFPHIVEHAWVEIYQTLFSTAWGAPESHPIGGEFRPFSFKSTLRFVLLPALLCAASAVWAIRRRRELSPLAAGFVLVSCVYLLMTLGSQRFLEYLAPFAAVAAGMTVARIHRLIGPAVLAAALVYTALVSRPLYDRVVQRTDMFPPKTATLLRKVIPEDAQVFTCDWQFTGEMMLALPGRKFMVALDPILFLREDPELYELWLRLTRRPPPYPASLVRERFQSHWVLCEARPHFRPFIRALDRDPEARPVLRAGPWFVFAIP